MSALITLVAFFATGLVADVTPPSLPSLLRGMPNVSEFTTLLGSPAYSSLFLNLSSNDRNWVTILAPTNEAFAKLPYSSFGAAFENNDTHVIEEVLRYHVLQGACPTESFNNKSELFSTWLDDSPVTNGQVVGAVQQEGRADVFTSGLGERSTLVYPNIRFSRGYLHTIDTFLTPPPPVIATAAAFNLTAFGGAIIHASLTDNTTNTKDLTIFAPSDAAFAALGATLEDMSVSELAGFLSYHVVNGTSTANGSQPFLGYKSNLADGMTIQMIRGGNITITEADNSIFVNSARVLQPDILLSNGVLHVIDNVLDYNATGVRPNPALASQQPVVRGSSLDGDVVPFTEYFPTTVTVVSASEAIPTGQGQAAETSFGVGDIGEDTIGKSSVSDSSLNVRATGSAAENMSASASASRTSGAPLMTVMSAEAKGLEASGALNIGVILLAFVVL